MEGSPKKLFPAEKRHAPKVTEGAGGIAWGRGVAVGVPTKSHETKMRRLAQMMRGGDAWGGLRGGGASGGAYNVAWVGSHGRKGRGRRRKGRFYVGEALLRSSCSNTPTVQGLRRRKTESVLRAGRRRKMLRSWRKGLEGRGSG